MHCALHTPVAFVCRTEASEATERSATELCSDASGKATVDHLPGKHCRNKGGMQGPQGKDVLNLS